MGLFGTLITCIHIFLTKKLKLLELQYSKWGYFRIFYMVLAKFRFLWYLQYTLLLTNEFTTTKLQSSDNYLCVIVC